MVKKNAQKEGLQNEVVRKNITGRNCRHKFICAVVVACLCPMVGCAQPSVLTIHSDLPNSLLSGAFVNNPPAEVADLVLYSARLKMGERIAEYHQMWPCGAKCPELPQLDTTTMALSKNLGDFYMEENGKRWYKVKGRDDIAVLIGEEENGLLRQWEYAGFFVAEEPAERAEGVVYYVDQYPDADLSAYPYGEMLSVIYGVESAADIEYITAKPVQMDNTEAGLEIQKQVGEHIYAERAQIVDFYLTVADVLFSGSVRNVYLEEDCYTYSFLADVQEEALGAERIYGMRDLVIRLANGEVIDNLRYDAMKGYLYEQGGNVSEFLPEGVVEKLNGIFGIE